MYCKFCGKELDENSKFCNYCGKQLESNSITNTVQNRNENSEKSGLSKALIFLLVMFGMFGLIFVGIKINMNKDSNGNIVDKIVERDITKSDYSVSTSQGLTSYSVTIIPNKKINSCNVQFNLYDSKENLIYSDTITKNDLIKNSSYTYTFDYGFTNALSGSKISYKITGKCVD